MLALLLTIVWLKFKAKQSFETKTFKELFFFKLLDCLISLISIK